MSHMSEITWDAWLLAGGVLGFALVAAVGVALDCRMRRAA